MVSPDVAIAEAPERTPSTLTSNNHPTETVRVLDLSDPRNPKTLETFNKVTSLLPDGGHGLIYLTNNDGLWILRYNRPSAARAIQEKATLRFRIRNHGHAAGLRIKPKGWLKAATPARRTIYRGTEPLSNLYRAF